MLAIGLSKAVSKRTPTLRSQLAFILSRLRSQDELSHPSCNRSSPSRQAHSLAQIDNETSSSSRVKLRNTRHDYPNGRVIRRGGRQHRETFETLGIDSLGRRSEVVILRDVPTTPSPINEEEPVAEVLTKVDIGEEHSPDQQDVLASIDVLRPSHVSLETADFNDLVKKLAQSYNKNQLKSYIEQNLPSAATTPPSHQTLTMSIWCRGTSDPNRRLPLQVKQSAKLSLNKLAEEIIRAVWGVSRHSELQEIGELEFTLADDDFNFMSCHHGESQQWQTLLPAALARTIDLIYHKATHTIRIIGRRHDTMDAAHVLADRIAAIQTIHLGLRDTISQELLTPARLDQIQRQTITIVKLEGRQLTIVGADIASCYNAKRGLVKLISSGQLTHIAVSRSVSTEQMTQSNHIVLPESLSRDRSEQLYRSAILGADNQGHFSSLTSKQRHLEHSIAGLDKLAVRSAASADALLDEPFRSAVFPQQPWTATIGYAASKQFTVDNDDQSPILASNLPGLRQVLQHFTSVNKATRTLTARLQSSPFAMMGSQSKEMPQLEVSFSIQDELFTSGSSWRFQLAGARWILPGIQLNVRLPDREADIQLSLPRIIEPTFELATTQKDSLLAFIKQVEASQVNTSSQAFATLLPKHDIQIPATLLSAQSTQEADCLTFICTALELSESHDFVPKHGSVDYAEATLLSSWTHGLRLQIQQISTTDATRTATRFRVVSTPSTEAGKGTTLAESDASRSTGTPSMSRIMRAAVGLVDLSTALARRLNLQTLLQ